MYLCFRNLYWIFYRYFPPHTGNICLCPLFVCCIMRRMKWKKHTLRLFLITGNSTICACDHCGSAAMKMPKKGRSQASDVMEMLVYAEPDLDIYERVNKKKQISVFQFQYDTIEVLQFRKGSSLLIWVELNSQIKTLFTNDYIKNNK